MNEQTNKKPNNKTEQNYVHTLLNSRRIQEALFFPVDNLKCKSRHSSEGQTCRAIADLNLGGAEK